VLDIALPLFPNESPKPTAGLDFLREITFDDDYLAPTFVVGITAFEENFDKLRAEFEKRSWPLYRSDANNISWLQNISALINHIDTSSTRITSKVDFAIVTALYDPELTAVLDLPWEWSGSMQLDEATMYRQGTFSSKNREFKVIATWPQRMGLVVSAALVTKINIAFRPRVIAASGICAGVRGKTSIGDMILASEAWTWESGKIVSTPRPGSLQPDPHSFSASTPIITLVQDLQGDKAWLTRIRSGWKGSAADAEAPRIIAAPMASGSTVVADQETVQDILRQSRKTAAIDMEAYAVYAASALGGNPIPLHFCVKSVCDFADDQKNDNFQSYAAYTSAQAVQRICYEVANRLL
jgi:nucleoside phosphorylase